MDKKPRHSGSGRRFRPRQQNPSNDPKQDPPRTEISEQDALVEFRKLLVSGNLEAQQAKVAFDETKDRATFTSVAKEIVLKYATATPLEAKAAPVPIAPESPPTPAQAEAEPAAAANGKSNKSRQAKRSNAEAPKGSKREKRWEPVKGAKKPQESASAAEEPEAITPPEAKQQEEARRTPPARDEAAARLQELFSSSESAFSTNFAFNRWRESVADENSSHTQLGQEQSLHSAIAEAAQQLEELTVNEVVTDVAAALIGSNETAPEAPTGSVAPHGVPVDGQFMPPYGFAPAPLYGVPQYQMVPPHADNSTPPPMGAFHPAFEPWGMMNAYRHNIPPGMSMSPPPQMGPFPGMQWDIRAASPEAFAHHPDAQPMPMHRGPEMHQYIPPHAFMMGPYGPFAMASPPPFMQVPYGRMYQGMPYPYPPQQGPVDGTPIENYEQQQNYGALPTPEAIVAPIIEQVVVDAIQQTSPEPVAEEPVVADLENNIAPEPEEVLEIEYVTVSPAVDTQSSTTSSIEEDGKTLLRLLRTAGATATASSLPTTPNVEEVQPEPESAAVPVIASAEHEEVKRDTEVKESKEDHQESPRVTKPYAHPMRFVSKNKVGAISVFVNNKRAPEGVTVRPQGNMVVKWHVTGELASDVNRKLVIGLHRIGVNSNSNNIVTKALAEHHMTVNEQMAFGEVPFRAPRSPGLFVYRLFDIDDDAETFATSSLFIVGISDQDVVPGLKYVMGLLNKSDNLRTVLVQLQQALKLVRQPISNSATRNLLSTCITVAVDHAEELAQKLHEADVAFQAVEPDSDKFKDAAKEYYEIEAKTSRSHAQVYDVLAAAANNSDVWKLVDDSLKSRINEMLALRYCPLLHILFVSREEMNAHRMKAFGFLPALFSRSTARPVAVTNALSRAIDEMLPSLLPSPDFFTRREGVRLRILQALESAGLMPKQSQLTVFGSSANNFGTDGSDLDMCLRHTQGTSPPEDKAKFIEQLAEFLERIGMSNLSCRATARIPIVIFHEPTTGLECDISLYNALAVRNTQLLNAYSRIDPRVRALAYIIKHWTKARHINSPPHGTLSSYGYILCLIHFLQTRQPPVLPNLQKLPPDWQGQDYAPNAVIPVPKLTVNHPVDGTECDTYFYVPAEHNFTTLNMYASRNIQSVGELLIEFFGYFAWQFDYKESVVSIRAGRRMPKYLKGEQDCWAQSSRLSIEDPFETWYDVAHPVKEKGHKFIRKEFVRAHTLCMKASGWDDGLNEPVPFQTLLAKVCEIGEMPAFMRSSDEHNEEGETTEVVAEKPANTVASKYLPVVKTEVPEHIVELTVAETATEQPVVNEDVVAPAEKAPKNRAQRGRGEKSSKKN